MADAREGRAGSDEGGRRRRRAEGQHGRESGGSRAATEIGVKKFHEIPFQKRGTRTSDAHYLGHEHPQSSLSFVSKLCVATGGRVIAVLAARAV